jgi:hypothetical protein
MNIEHNEVEVNGVKYIRKDSVTETPALNKAGYAIVRCISAGVFMGHVAESDLAKGTVKLKDARRLWYWSGAASLSQLATDGTVKPKDCKFPCAVAEISLTQVIEVIPVTSKAFDSINSVPVWKQ